MKLTQLRIRNFRSCRDISLEIGKLHALVGANNSGKSAVLRALDFLFNPSTKSLNEESFWNKDTALEIRVEAIFTDLSEKEKEALSGCLKPDGTFHMARSAKLGAKSGESGSDDDENKIMISQHFKQPTPKLEWLQEGKVSVKTVAEWWKTKDQLTINGVSFADSWPAETKKPGVEDWKEKAKQFVAANAASIPMDEAWLDNPKGYANVLKGTLPFFILIPAIRDVTEESKGTKTSPFGKLLFAILDTVTASSSATICSPSKRSNRSSPAKSSASSLTRLTTPAARSHIMMTGLNTQFGYR